MHLRHVMAASLALVGLSDVSASQDLPATDLALTMTDSPDPVGGSWGAQSSVLTYTLTISNLGPAPARNVRLIIPPPPIGLPFIHQANPACVPQPYPYHYLCEFAQIPPNAAASAAVSVMVGEWVPAVLKSGVATVSAANPDPVPGNNSASVTTTVLPSVWGHCEAGRDEGDAGLERWFCGIWREGAQSPTSTVSYAFGGGTATPGVDFVPHSGVVTFGPGEVVKEIPFESIGDTLPEPDDTFRVLLRNPVGAIVLSDPSLLWDVIHNDDQGAVVGDLSHGFVYRGPVPSHPTERVADIFSVQMGIPASYEVVVDEVSGDAGPLRPAIRSFAAPSPGMIFGIPTGTGGASSLRIPNFHVAVPHRTVTVVGDGCNADCGPDDTYRLRFYETTLAGGYFNNIGGQESILVLQNAGSDTVHCDVPFWAPGGFMLAWRELVLAPHGSQVLRTADVPELAGCSGSITVVHDAPYGTVTGKVISFDPAGGFSFETFLEPRPR